MTQLIQPLLVLVCERDGTLPLVRLARRLLDQVVAHALAVVAVRHVCDFYMPGHIVRQTCVVHREAHAAALA